MREIQLIEIASEIGAGTRGASLGIAATKIAALNAGNDFFARHASIQVQDENQLLLEPVNSPNAIRIQGIVKVYERLQHTVSEVLENNARFPLVLAADHASAGGTIAGIRKAFPDLRLGVVWIDAHADLHSPYTSPSGNVHGMPLAASLGEDNTAHARNDVKEISLEGWEALKNMGGINPKIKAEDIVFVGVRDIEMEEIALMERESIRNFSVDELRTKGATNVATETLDYLQECDIIYVSFDVDSMDCDVVSRGTGTPVPQGIYEEEAATLIQALLGSDKVCCFEVVEINPTLDNKCNVMAETAFRILDKAVGVIQSK